MRTVLLSGVAALGFALAAGAAYANPQADGGSNNYNWVDSDANATAVGGNGGEGGDGVDAENGQVIWYNGGTGGNGGNGGYASAYAASETGNAKTSAVSRQEMTAYATGYATQEVYYYGHNSLGNGASVSGMGAAAGVFSAQAQAAIGSAQQGGVALSVAAHNINIQ